MKRLLTIFLTCLPGLLFPQFKYFSLGYNGNMFTSSNLDYVIDRYNETRVYLDETMAYPHYLDGFDVHIGVNGKVLVDVGYTWRSSMVFASGIDITGIEQQRDLKYKFGAFDIGLGIQVIDAGTKVAIGFNQTVGSEKVYTRVGPASDISETDYSLVFNKFNPGCDAFIQILIPFSEKAGLILKPYYHFSYIATDYAELNDEINPATSLLDDPVLESKAGGFGASLMLTFLNEY